MENFVLWSVSAEKREPRLSFFATWVHVQRIGKGTRDMVAEMLADLGVEGASVREWTVAHFVTSYLSDNPDSDDWRDVWMDTAEIKLQLSKPVAVKAQDSTLIRTWARDKSWKRQDRFVPVECVVVADFKSAEAVARAKKVLKTLEKAIADDSFMDTLHSEVPSAPKRLFKEMRDRVLAQKDNDAFSLTVRQRPGLPRQLLLSLGVQDEAFFVDGAQLACLISDLVHELDGTTSWNEIMSIE